MTNLRVWEREWFDTGRLAEVHENVWRQGMSLWESQGEDRRSFADLAVTLYFGNSRHGFDGYRNGLAEVFGVLDSPGYNVIQSIVDTKAAHISRNKIRPLFVTERGDSKLKEKALGMQRAVEAIFQESGIYGPLGVSVCFDGQLFEAGGVKITPDYANSRVNIERVFAHEVLVSVQESRLGQPRQMWHVQSVDRAALVEMFDDEATRRAIEEAPPAPDTLAESRGEHHEMVADQVMVVEYWHLPSGRVDLSKDESFGIDEDGDLDPNIDPGHDGRRVLCIQGATLIDEPWPYDYFPIALFKPMPEPVGFWSRTIPETLASAQMALNKWQARIEGILNLHAVPRLLVWNQAKLKTQQLTNGWADVIHTAVQPGQAVLPLQPPSVPAEIFRRIEDIIRWAERQSGLSEMSIAATRPPGIEHAPALQHLSDTESVRHTPAFRAWEQFHLDAARCIVDCLRLLAKRDEGFEVIWGNSKQLKRIKWADVDLHEDRYHLKVWPANLLPQTPAAKQARVIEMLQAQLIGQEEALALLDFPDIEAITGDTTAELENIERKIEKAKAGEPEAEWVPDAYLNLDMAKAQAKQAINRMEADEEDPEAIDRVRQFFEDCVELQLRATADIANAEQGMGPPPPGPPGPPMPGGLPPGPPMPMPPPPAE